MATFEPRPGTRADAWELVRLRTVMFGAMHGVPVTPGPWQEAAVKLIDDQLDSPEPLLGAFVIDDPDRPGSLAACAVGAIDPRLASPRNPQGRAGYVYNVCTDERHRRRGFARACMLALIDWFRTHGVDKIDLRATADGEPLYRSLGFQPETIMRLRL